MKRPRSSMTAEGTRHDANFRHSVEQPHLECQLVRVPVIIVVHECYQIPASLGNASVPSRARAAVPLDDQPAAWILNCNALHRQGRAVHRTVVDDEQFEVGERLPQHCCDRSANETFGVERRHHDADAWRRRAAQGINSDTGVTDTRQAEAGRQWRQLLYSYGPSATVLQSAPRTNSLTSTRPMSIVSSSPRQE